MRFKLCSLVLAVACSSCHLPKIENLRFSSGTVADDDVEEPIPGAASQYAPLLARSNDFVKLFQAHQVKAFYARGFSDSLKQKTSESDFERLYSTVLSSVGGFQSFKPGQWKFLVHRSPRGSMVDSIKIVHHERGILEYIFTFADAHGSDLIGVHFRLRPARPGTTVP